MSSNGFNSGKYHTGYSVIYCCNSAKDFNCNHCFAWFDCFSFYLQSLNSPIKSVFSEILHYSRSTTQFFNFKSTFVYSLMSSFSTSPTVVNCCVSIASMEQILRDAGSTPLNHTKSIWSLHFCLRSLGSLILELSIVAWIVFIHLPLISHFSTFMHLRLSVCIQALFEATFLKGRIYFVFSSSKMSFRTALMLWKM